MCYSPPPRFLPHSEEKGSVMESTFCQIKFEWIGGMTTIPSEWICKGLSSFLAHVPVSRSSQKQEEVPLYERAHITPIWAGIYSYVTRLEAPSERFGRPGYNLVTSTSGLNTKQMWDDVWFIYIYLLLFTPLKERGRSVYCYGSTTTFLNEFFFPPIPNLTVTACEVGPFEAAGTVQSPHGHYFHNRLSWQLPRCSAAQH